MTEWITDREPTEQDGDEFGHVYNADLERVMYYESSVRNGNPWCKVEWVRKDPEPYQPPEPDTSLSASIERFRELCLHDDATELDFADMDRVIEAAKKWDEWKDVIEDDTPMPDDEVESIMKNEDFQQSDPDNVGEGWRRLGEDEVIQEGDQYIGDKSIKSYYRPDSWVEETEKGFGTVPRERETLMFRRRLEEPSMAASPGDSCGAEGQERTQPREQSDDPQEVQ